MATHQKGLSPTPKKKRAARQNNDFHKMCGMHVYGYVFGVSPPGGGSQMRTHAWHACQRIGWHCVAQRVAAKRVARAMKSERVAAKLEQGQRATGRGRSQPARAGRGQPAAAAVAAGIKTSSFLSAIIFADARCIMLL